MEARSTAKRTAFSMQHVSMQSRRALGQPCNMLSSMPLAAAQSCGSPARTLHGHGCTVLPAEQQACSSLKDAFHIHRSARGSHLRLVGARMHTRIC